LSNIPTPFALSDLARIDFRRAQGRVIIAKVAQSGRVQAGIVLL
jgi:hypothetical protein